MENVKKWALVDFDNDYDADAVYWGPQQCKDLFWWLNLPSPMSRCFETQPFTNEFTTDASLEGWGVVYTSQHFFGPWEDEEETLIDELELMTVMVALEIFPVVKDQANLQVFCDNTVAIAYMWEFIRLINEN